LGEFLSEAVPVLGIPVHPLTVPQLHNAIEISISGGRHDLVLHVNVHALNLARKHDWLPDLYRSARIVFCDGAGVMLGARILGYRIPERITYADWMWELARLACARGHRLFFLGGREGVAERAAGQLRDRFPGISIVGCHQGYFDKTPGSPENEGVLAAINATRPHILLVGFGMPVQERWLLENWDRVNANVALTGGAVFDYVSGDLRRPPRWLRAVGMEWLGRLAIERRRLAGRYLIGNPLFLCRVLMERLRRAWD
jgi:N-acetylglucosaminyldiphosphoundecaprenol N-acetyl-beta-D-mannosaminyltransferase